MRGLPFLLTFARNFDQLHFRQKVNIIPEQEEQFASANARVVGGREERNLV